MPEEDPDYESQSSSDEGEEEKSAPGSEKATVTFTPEEKQALIEEASELRKHITHYIKEETSSGAFVKLNWSAPRDASWTNPTLQCVTADEIFTLLKSSTFITHDIQCPYNEAIADFSVDQHYIVLKRWHNLNRGMEFRCFVKSGIIVAISQRDATAYFEFLPPLKDDIIKTVKSFIETKIKPVDYLQGEDYIIDVYIESK